MNPTSIALINISADRDTNRRSITNGHADLNFNRSVSHADIVNLIGVISVPTSPGQSKSFAQSRVWDLANKSPDFKGRRTALVLTAGLIVNNTNCYFRRIYPLRKSSSGYLFNFFVLLNQFFTFQHNWRGGSNTQHLFRPANGQSFDLHWPKRTKREKLEWIRRADLARTPFCFFSFFFSFTPSTVFCQRFQRNYWVCRHESWRAASWELKNARRILTFEESLRFATYVRCECVFTVGILRTRR